MVRLRIFRERIEEARWVRWSDMRSSGAAGLAYMAAVFVSEGLGLYDWIGRQAGCTMQQAHDPRYFCPSGGHVFSVWFLLAFTIVLGLLVGYHAILSRNVRQLILVGVTQLAVVAALVWISQVSSYHVHLR